MLYELSSRLKLYFVEKMLIVSSDSVVVFVVEFVVEFVIFA